MAQGKFGSVGLTPKERRFMQAYFRTSNKLRAYLEICPDVSEDSASTMGCRLYDRITAKVDWSVLLDLAGLDDTRLAQELEKRLVAQKSEFYQGEEVAVVEDNGTRMRATELLADLRGKRKTEVNLLAELPGIVVETQGDE